MLKLGLIREYKTPPDRRVAFTPKQCAAIQNKYSNIKILVESSSDRIFPDSDYVAQNIEVTQNIADADVLLGIKEIPVEKLINSKTYLFFSHTIKKQPHNQNMLKAILAKNINLIDYECLSKPDGTRVLGFGRYAGLVGVYETFKALGLKNSSFQLKPAYQCKNYSELLSELKSVAKIIKSGKHKIVVTGGGRVPKGAEELLHALQIKKVDSFDFLNNAYDETVFTQLGSEQLYQNKNGDKWDPSHFKNNHSQYLTKFTPYTFKADILINGLFWANDMPQLFKKEDTKANNFTVKLIGDISCDVEGSVPITVKDTSAFNPVFGWNPATQNVCEPFLPNSIDVMAVSNLPSELPADSSEGFGKDLFELVLPELLLPESDMIKGANICKDGMLTPKFNYLSDYVS